MSKTHEMSVGLLQTWPYGAVQDNVTYAKLLGSRNLASNDVNDEDGGPHQRPLWCCCL
ncbi:MAG: hypothetical protein ACLS3V_07265 [Streptococcus sp.]